MPLNAPLSASERADAQVAAGQFTTVVEGDSLDAATLVEEAARGAVKDPAPSGHDHHMHHGADAPPPAPTTTSTPNVPADMPPEPQKGDPEHAH